MRKSILAAYLALVVIVTIIYTPYAEAAADNRVAITEWIVEHSGHKVSSAEAKHIAAVVVKKSKKYNIDPFLIVAVIKNESGFNKNARNKSGATGLMQVIPKWHRAKIGSRKINNIETNIDVGTMILSEYLDKSGGDIKKALRLYSGGSKTYSNKLYKTYSKVKSHNTIYRFMNERPINIAYNFHKPRM